MIKLAQTAQQIAPGLQPGLFLLLLPLPMAQSSTPSEAIAQ
jgi:hypothetical protein